MTTEQKQNVAAVRDRDAAQDEAVRFGWTTSTHCRRLDDVPQTTLRE